jgi:hypothetical protein
MRVATGDQREPVDSRPKFPRPGGPDEPASHLTNPSPHGLLTPKLKAFNINPYSRTADKR